MKGAIGTGSYGEVFRAVVRNQVLNVASRLVTNSYGPFVFASFRVSFDHGLGFELGNLNLGPPF